MLTGLVSSTPKPAMRSLNQGRVGEVMPDIMPEARTRAAIVPVESIIAPFIGAPRVIWLGVTSQRYRRGRRYEANWLHATHQEYRSVRRPTSSASSSPRSVKAPGPEVWAEAP